MMTYFVIRYLCKKVTKICKTLTSERSHRIISIKLTWRHSGEFNVTDSDLTGFLSFMKSWSEINLFWSVGVAILTVLVHIVFAVAIYRDATRLNREQALVIAGVGPAIWCVATLVGGVITAAIYWAMHHSRLNPTIPTSATESDETEV